MQAHKGEPTASKRVGGRRYTRGEKQNGEKQEGDGV